MGNGTILEYMFSLKKEKVKSRIVVRKNRENIILYSLDLSMRIVRVRRMPSREVLSEIPVFMISEQSCRSLWCSLKES
jgi:hypothetical protein